MNRILLACGLASLAWCSLAHAQPPVTSKTATRITEIELRRKAAQEFVTDVALVASKSRDATALKYAQILSTGNVLFAPVASQVRPNNFAIQMLDKSPEHYARLIGICILAKPDELLNPLWAHKLNDANFVAEYNSDINCILLPQPRLSHFSPIYIGLVGQHEMALFAHRPAKSDAQNDHTKKLSDELQAYEFEFSLLERLGGPSFAAVLKKEVSRLAHGVVKNDGEYRFPNAVSYATYQKELDEVFGKKPWNIDEGMMRMTLLYLDALFTYAKTSEKTQDAWNFKMSVMRDINPGM
jgi:hypothetical protein